MALQPLARREASSLQATCAHSEGNDGLRTGKEVATVRLTEIKDCEVYSADGEKIGKVDEIYVDDQTSEPEWVTLGTGVLGTSKRFVPLKGASVTGDGMQVPFTKDQLKDAPDVDVDEGYLDDNAEMQLYEYYGLRRGMAGQEMRRPGTYETGTTTPGEAGRRRYRRWVD